MGGEVINQNSLQEMTTFVGSGSYGIGIAEATILGRTIWQHGGTIWGGYNSSMMYDPASGAIICVLINQLPAQAFQVAIGLLADLVDQGLGFHETPMVNELLIYPNPTLNSIDISIKHSEELPYEITNSEGIVYIQGILEPGQTQILLEQLTKGVYYLTLKKNHINNVYKVIKQ